jgi:hypothetical protein
MKCREMLAVVDIYSCSVYWCDIVSKVASSVEGKGNLT